jgi:hypothetical protein
MRRRPWTDVEGKCLATLVVGASRVLDFNYVPCAVDPCAAHCFVQLLLSASHH